MIILDTCALVYDALAPEKLGKNAKKYIIAATIHYHGKLVTCDKKLGQLDELIIIWD